MNLQSYYWGRGEDREQMECYLEDEINPEIL